MTADSLTPSEPDPLVAAQAPPADVSIPLPEVNTPLSNSAITARLSQAARRGRLAGFQPEASPNLFSVEAFATPFEHKLVARAEDSPTGGTRLLFKTKFLPKAPAIFLIAIVISIWPGVWMTHSMLVTWFSWYPAKEWVTWAWYFPLTIVPLPWYLLKSWRKSTAEAHADALAQIERIRTELGGAQGTA